MIRMAARGANKRHIGRKTTAMNERGLERVLAQVLSGLLLALAMRAQWFMDSSPFATALFAAGLFAGLPVPAMGLGVLLGCRYEVLGVQALLGALGPAFSLALYALSRVLRLRAKGQNDGGMSWLNSEDALCAFISGLSMFLSGAVVLPASAYAWAQLAAGSIIALLIAPVLLGALRVRAERSRLMTDEQMALLLLIALMGLRGIPGIGYTAGTVFAAAVTLVAGGARRGLRRDGGHTDGNGAAADGG